MRLALHPVLSVKRDGSGKLTATRSEGQSRCAARSAKASSISICAHHALRTAQALEDDLKAVFADVRVAVLDWRAMQQRLREAIGAYQKNPPPIPIEELTESIAFLQWLLDNHFTFLGMREYHFDGGAKKGELEPIADTGLGILRKAEIEVLRRGNELVAISPQIREFLMQPAALIITKSDVRATVHRRSAMDYVGVKLFDAEGDACPANCASSGSSPRRPIRRIPTISRCCARSCSASSRRRGFSPSGHSGKALDRRPRKLSAR